MVDPTLLNYITAELARGVNREQLIKTLLTGGWQQSQIDEALNSPTQPNQTRKPVRVYTEADFSITKLWIFKITLLQLPSTLFLLVLSIFSMQYIIFALFSLFVVVPLSIISNWLTRKFFRFRTETDFFFLKQGILSRKQYHLPYGVIQHAIVKQDLFDRIFGLASLLIENAAQGAGIPQISRKAMVYQSTARTPEFVGSSGNKISIPGLKKADAEALKEVILQKIKDHPLDDNASGL